MCSLIGKSQTQLPFGHRLLTFMDTTHNNGDSGSKWQWIFYTGALVQASSKQVDSCRGAEDSDGNDTIIEVL